MAEEEVLVAAAGASPASSDLKRKHEDMEPTVPEPTMVDSNADTIENESDSVKIADKEGEDQPVVDGESDELEAKRPRLEDKPDGLVTENGYKAEKVDLLEDAEQKYSEDASQVEGGEQQSDEVTGTMNKEKTADDLQTGDNQPPSVDSSQLESARQQQAGTEFQEPTAEVPTLGDNSSVDQQPASETQTVSRKMEVPNNKVGVLIGKAGDTIKFLQINSGAKIQITRDADADPHSTTRPVELIGTLENISKAEKLIKDVIAEADAGGSPSLVARGFSTIQAAGAAEQILIQVPNEKVGVIIGKGGETIKNLQTRSGARIQLIPQHLPEGDQSKERTVRVSGDKKQIEVAREMIKEVMNQPVRPSHSGGYSQQQFRPPRGPAAPPQWGPRGSHPAQATGYDYRQRGPYPSQHSQYPHHQAYGNYPSQMAPRSSFGPGWEPRPSTMQGPPPPSGGGYDYYGGQGHVIDAPASTPQSHPSAAHGLPGPSPSPMGPTHTQGGYNYGQPAPYSQTAAPPQNYGHGYNENQATAHHSYGGHGGGPQPGGYPQGYAPQDQYGKAPSYGMPPTHGPPQQYGQPRASQPGDMPYQGQPYAQNVPPQQTYPYASSGPMQQTYPPYGSANDGYNQQPPPVSGSAPVYPQQGGMQPVSGYGQPGGQQGFGYAQVGQTGGYNSSYPTSQPGYTEQPAPQNINAGYGYQGGSTDPAFGSASGSAYGAPPSAQAGYVQPAPAPAPAPASAPTQTGYDQSTLQAAGGYGSVPVGAPAGYGKSVSPQPGGYAQQYESAQMYGAPR
ncbi:hypothetical protein NMG60_11035861 [Bertholletia excelsa]